MPPAWRHHATAGLALTDASNDATVTSWTLSQYVNQLREDLAAAAAAGDEQTRQTAALLGAAIEPAAGWP